METPSQSTHGSTIGIVIVIALLVLGAFYFLDNRVDTPDLDQNTPLNEFDSTDDVAAEDTDDLDEELDQIDTELEAELENTEE